MLKNFLRKHIAIIVAHPDDESVLAAGTIMKHKRDGGKTSLFCATLGENGSAYMLQPVSKTDVKKIRMKELRAATRCLGIKKLYIGSLPDSKIQDYKNKLKMEVSNFLKEIKPDLIISFGDDGFTGHADHIVVGKVAKIVSNKMNIEFWEFAKPPRSKCPDLEIYLNKKRKNGLYKNTKIKNESTPIVVKVNPELKLEVLRLYRTQFLGINPYNVFPKKIAEHLLRNEYFRCIK